MVQILFFWSLGTSLDQSSNAILLSSNIYFIVSSESLFVNQDLVDKFLYSCHLHAR